MGRETNRPITFFDAQYMVDNEGFTALQTITETNQCMTRADIEAYLNADTSNFSSYASNQLVPYDLLQPISSIEMIAVLQAGNIVVYWDFPGATNVNTYELWYSHNGGSYSLLTTGTSSPINASDILPDPETGGYCFKIRAKYNDNSYSEFSNIDCVELYQMVMKTTSNSSNWCFNRFRLYTADSSVEVQARRPDGTILDTQPFHDPNYTAWGANYEHTFLFDFSYNTGGEEIEIYIKGLTASMKFQQLYAYTGHAGSAVRWSEDPNITQGISNAELSYIDFGRLKFDADYNGGTARGVAFVYLENNGLTDIANPDQFYGGILDISNNNLSSSDIDNVIIGCDNQGRHDGTINWTNSGTATSASSTAYQNLISKNWNLSGALPTNDSISVSPSEMNLSSNSGSQIASVTADSSWTLSESISWISVSPTSGSSDSNISISYSSNSGGLRTGTINLSLNNGDDSTVLTVNQAASQSEPISVSPNPYTGVSSSGANIIVSVTANGPWSIGQYNSALTPLGETSTGTYNSDVEISVSENLNTTERSLFMAFEKDNTTEFVNLEIIQDAAGGGGTTTS